VTGELVTTRNGREIYRTGPTRVAGARVGREFSLDRSLLDRDKTLYSSAGGPIPALTAIHFNLPRNFVVPGWYLGPGG